MNSVRADRFHIVTSSNSRNGRPTRNLLGVFTRVSEAANDSRSDFSKPMAGDHADDLASVTEDAIQSTFPIQLQLNAKDSTLDALIAPSSSAHGCLLIEDGPVFCQISGANDLLSVSLALGKISTQSKSIEVKVKVSNNSSFKIPSFQLTFLLNSAVSTCSGFNSSPSDRFSAVSGGVVASIHQETCGDSIFFDESLFHNRFGLEYFPQNAVIERRITLICNFFAPFDVITRIEYNDLDQGGLAYSLFGGSEEPPINKRIHPLYLTDYQTSLSRRGGAGASSKWNAIIDLAPFHVPASSLIQPYGRNSFSSLREHALYPIIGQFRNSHHLMLTNEGVHSSEKQLSLYDLRWRQPVQAKVQLQANILLPWKVFQAQFQRLSLNNAHVVHVLGSSQPSSEIVISNLLSHIQETSYLQPNRIGFGLSCVAVQDLHPPYCVGWCLQTLWGNEISVLFSPAMDIHHSSEELYQEIGQLEIRCDQKHLLKHLLGDIDEFIYSLSGGLFSISD